MLGNFVDVICHELTPLAVVFAFKIEQINYCRIDLKMILWLER